MWNGTKDSSMVFDEWSYRYLAKINPKKSERKSPFNEKFAKRDLRNRERIMRERKMKKT